MFQNLKHKQQEKYQQKLRQIKAEEGQKLADYVNQHKDKFGFQLGKDQAWKLTADNADQIEEYFSGAGELSGLPDVLVGILETIKKSLIELAAKDEQLSIRMQKKILDRIKKRN